MFGRPSLRLTNTIAVLALSLVAACDNSRDASGIAGTGGTAGAGGDSPTLTGFLVDSPVAGVTYSTPTQFGVTDRGGGFRYQEGEMVRFSLGGTLLGEVQGQARVTPFDLVRNAEVVSGTEEVLDAAFDVAHPINAVINMSVLLQTLDNDAFLGNGINIAPEVADLFSGVAVDFDQPWDLFALNQDFRAAFIEAKRLGYFEPDRFVRHPMAAMQHLYDTLEIDSGMFGPVRVEKDGFVRSNFAYTSEGIPASNFEIRFFYDSTWRQVLADVPSVGEVLATEYNVHGDLERTSSFGCEYTWSYSDSSVTREILCPSSSTPHKVRTTFFDRRMDPVLVQLDNDADGVVDSFSFRDFDDNHRLTRSEGFTADGRLVRVEVHAYDEHGNETLYTDDRGADGTNEYQTEWTYDAFGNLTRFEHQVGDETRVTTYDWAYDADGNPIRRTQDRGDDGIADEVLMWSYDSEGRRTQQLNDYQADGTVDWATNWAYDEHGNQIREELDFDLDGEAERFDATTYQSTGWAAVPYYRRSRQLYQLRLFE